MTVWMPRWLYFGLVSSGNHQTLCRDFGKPSRKPKGAGNSVDIIYLFSVFSHTTEDDMKVYLKDFARILNKGCKMFFTTFVEYNVPNVSINPENYHLKCSGPLHIVRYNKDYLFYALSEYGYAILNFTHRTEADGQSAIYLCK